MNLKQKKSGKKKFEKKLNLLDLIGQLLNKITIFYFFKQKMENDI